MIKAEFFYKNKILVAFYIVIALFGIGQIVTPGFGTASSLVNILSLSSFLGIVTLGQMFVILSGNGGIDLSVATLMSFGAVLAAKIMMGLDQNMPLAIIVVALVGLGFGLLSGLGVTLLNIPPLIMTLAMASVITGVSLVYTNGLPDGSAAPALMVLGQQRTLGLPNIFWLWIVIIAGVSIFLKYSRWATKLYGVGSNALAAELSGTSKNKTLIVAYALSGMVSMLAGLLYLGYTGTAYLTLGKSYLMPSITSAVIGGVSLSGGEGNYGGAAMGAVVLTVLTALLTAMNISEAQREIIFGLVLVVLLLVYARKRSV